MRKFEDVIKSPRLSITTVQDNSIRGLSAFLSHPAYKSNDIAIIAGWDEQAIDGKKLEHVSVSLRRRCPTWEEMCIVKDIFWADNECVIQFHPPKHKYTNMHPYCLHMWRKPGWEPEMDWD